MKYEQGIHISLIHSYEYLEVPTNRSYALRKRWSRTMRRECEQGIHISLIHSYEYLEVPTNRLIRITHKVEEAAAAAKRPAVRRTMSII